MPGNIKVGKHMKTINNTTNSFANSDVCVVHSCPTDSSLQVQQMLEWLYMIPYDSLVPKRSKEYFPRTAAPNLSPFQTPTIYIITCI